MLPLIGERFKSSVYDFKGNTAEHARTLEVTEARLTSPDSKDNQDCAWLTADAIRYIPQITQVDLNLVLLRLKYLMH